jgi:hypothetical protein
MARKMQWVLPDELNPPDIVCFKVFIPKERFYLAAFMGSMWQLTKPYLWADDPEHKAIQAGARMVRVFDTMVRDECDPDCPPCFGDIGDDMPQFRQEGCLLQVQCANGDWETIYDPSQCIVSGASQPPPAGDVAPGQCLEWDVVLQGNGQWRLPVAVNNGDIVTITGAAGLWSDGSINPWKCPDGNNGPFGICIPSTAGFDGGDPVPTQFHMRLIAQTSMAGYDAFNTVIGFAGLSGDDTLTFQANDSDLTNNAGSVHFHVKFCKANATPVAISYTFGSGPASANYGDLVTALSADAGFATCAEVFDLTMHFDPCVDMTFVSLADWSLRNCTDGDTLYSYRDCDDTIHTVTNADAGGAAPVGITLRNIKLFELIGANNFTCVIRLEPAT